MLSRGAQRRQGAKAIPVSTAPDHLNRCKHTQNMIFVYFNVFAVESRGVSFYLGSTRKARGRFLSRPRRVNIINIQLNVCVSVVMCAGEQIKS